VVWFSTEFWYGFQPVYTLIEVDYSFPNLLSLPYCSIVKEIAINSYNSKQSPIGTGPFKLDSYEANQSISFNKNSDYWEKIDHKQIPIIDKVEIALTTDDNYSFLLFKNQKTNFLELNIPLVEQLKSTDLFFEYKEDIFETIQLNFYLFNLDKIKDTLIRQGINYAIDRQKMKELLGDNGTITQSLFPKMFEELSEPQKILEYKPEKAKEYLKTQLEIKLVVFEDMLSRSLANQFKKDLKAFDIIVEIESVPFPVLVDRLSTGNYDIIQIYWGMLYADPYHFLTPFKSSSFPPTGNNFNKYSNAVFDSIVNEALKRPIDEQNKLYLDAENIILNDMPFFLAYYSNIIRISNGDYELPINPLLYKYYKNAIPTE